MFSSAADRTPIAASVALAAVWFWAGTVVAISGLETPIRTRIVEVPVQHYLAIGYRLFHSVNFCEWLLALVIVIALAIAAWKQRMFRLPLTIALVLVGVLMAQTVLLYGPLDARTLLKLAGEPVPRHHYHWSYIAAELVKLALLIATGTVLLRRQRQGPNASLAAPSQCSTADVPGPSSLQD